MLVNPGGLIAPEDVVGRDDLIAKLWKRLERQSVMLTGERRTGKTSILRKMQAEAPDGFVVLTVNLDFEGLYSPLEFVEQVYRDAERLLRPHQRKSGFRRAFEKLAGFEIAGVIKFPENLAPNWKLLLEQLLADVATLPGRRLVFLWDEMAVFANNVMLRSNANLSAEILSVLRAARQRYPNIRMVYTGSIGFHALTAVMAKAGINSPLLNDMFVQEVPPISPDDGALLAARLLESEAVRTTDRDAVARTVAAAAGYIPFYIHYIVDALTERDGIQNEASVAEVVKQRLHADSDPWLMKHYFTRLEHYPSEHRGPARSILDILADAGSLEFDPLLARLRTRVPTEDRDPVQEVIMLLKHDFYITQSESGEYAFRSALLRQWWKHERAA